MRTGRWKRIAWAASLLLAVACTYRASALPLPLKAQPAPRPAAELLLRGERVLTFGGYELNIAFTRGGRLVCFDITAAPPPKARCSPPTSPAPSAEVRLGARG